MIASPKRIQRRRTKGWRMPPGAVYVGRPTPWGNPWTMKLAAAEGFASCLTLRQLAWRTVFLYRRDLLADAELLDAARRVLRGHDLVCWCQLDWPCHSNVLLEIVNA